MRTVHRTGITRQVTLVLGGMSLALAMASHSVGAQSVDALLGAPAVVSADAIARGRYFEIALELNIDNVYRATVLAHQQLDGIILLDARDILAHAGWRRTPPGAAVRVKPHAGESHTTLCRSVANRREPSCFVPAATLAAALDVILEVDLASAVVVIREAAHLPVVRRARLLRESRIAAAPDRSAAETARRQAEAERRRIADSVFVLSTLPITVDATPPMLLPRAVGGTLGVVQLDYLLSAQHGISRSRSVSGDALPGAWQFGALMRASTHLAGGDLGTDLRRDFTGTKLDNTTWTFRPRPGSTRPIVHVGVVDDASPQPVRLDGVMFGRPIRENYRPRMVSIATAARPEWNYVGLVNDQLINMQRLADTSMAMTIPVTGDAVRYDVIGWGADGLERRYSRMVHSPAAQLPRGDVRYLASVGRCTAAITLFVADSAPCRWRAATDWRVGLHPRFTGRAGATWTDGQWQPYVGANALVGSAIVLEALFGAPRPGETLSQWQATWNPTPWHLLTVSGSRSLGRSLHSAQWQVGVPAIKRLSLMGMWNRAAGLSDQMDLGHIGLVGQVGAFRTEVFGRLNRMRLGTSVRMPPISMAWDAETQSPSTTTASMLLRASSISAPTGSLVTMGSSNVNTMTVQSTGIDVSAAPRWMSMRGAPWWIRGSLALDERQSGTTSQGRTMRLDLRLNGSLPRAEIEIGRTFSQAQRTGRWMLMISPRLPQTRLTTSASHNTAVGNIDGRPWIERVSTVTQMATGSVLLNAREQSVRATADRAVRGGGLRIRVYLDLDNNGRYDSSEPVLRQVGVVAGNRRASTDVEGRAEIIGLPASEPVIVSVDSTSLPLPCWRPISQQWVVQVPSAGIGEIDLGLRYGAILDGRLIADASTAPGAASPPVLPSRLILTHLERNERFEVDVMNDGGFYLLGLPAGPYRVLRRDAPSGGLASSGRPSGGDTLVIPAPPAGLAAPSTCHVVTTQLPLASVTLAPARSAP
ncbi:hypothetical protein GAU_1025 [Gemmatimonas aurantiaca T-27]|uniref:Carboxypeptidase regulatory-like domain-containing protein n=1 Tax=Gemmatimonas aurantiaca (strain DSM 14586 / JCM 11422 / NBRC 100505 / T-27) TaxID=379066 RepID=C1A757_GEMAT|nr:hypothetical protein [Gemmatimonas aurantiaca]BAH38067.1 hypothetical protein GAU_1025 [Gemmatimonas aurantiaca T-27]